MRKRKKSNRNLNIDINQQFFLQKHHKFVAQIDQRSYTTEQLQPKLKESGRQVRTFALI